MEKGRCSSSILPNFTSIGLVLVRPVRNACDLWDILPPWLLYKQKAGSRHGAATRHLPGATGRMDSADVDALRKRLPHLSLPDAKLPFQLSKGSGMIEKKKS